MRATAARAWSGSYTVSGSTVLQAIEATGAEPVPCQPRGNRMQSAQPRDVGMLILVIGLFLILFVVTLLVGSPSR